MDKAEGLNDFYFTSAQRNKDWKYIEELSLWKSIKNLSWCNLDVW